MKTRLPLYLSALAVLALLLTGCFKEYPGDPVPDPNATRTVPGATAPANQEATSGAFRPADRTQNRPGR
ncbi:MAG: hypothetical protein OHK0029_40580 [Armatimonadaceae bacterium]